MSTSRRLTASAVLIGALVAGSVLTACSKSTPAGGTATLPTAPPTTADPWAVPSTISPDYINRVLAKLNQIDGDAFRDARSANAVTDRYRSLEASIRVGEAELALRVKDLNANLASGFAGIPPNPGDRKMNVTALLPAPSPCVLAAVDVDFTAVAMHPIHYPQWYVALVPQPANPTNPTRWGLADDGFERGGGAPSPNQACTAS